MINFTSDSIQSIFNFLTQEEIFALRLTCKTFNIVATSNQIIMPFLNRLKAIDKTISTLPSEGMMSATWCYEHFIKEFNRLANSQANETKDFLTANASSNDDEIKNKIISLKDLEGNADNRHIQLSVLEQKHRLLEDLNTTLIKPKINLNSTKLALRDLGITRIPESLFTQPEYEDYWKKLQEIDCTETSLQSLPQSLGDCQALKVLHCFKNKLKSLPESLGNCQGLQRLICNHNQLEALPESLGNCKTLQEIYCNANKLKSLPESLGKCPLQVLNCSDNQLKSLPASIGNCQALQQLFCNHNQLEALPETLVNCEALQGIYCYNNKLKFLPESIGKCQALQVLSCGENELKALPASLAHCQRLKTVSCFGNRLETLPESLGNCQALEMVNCSLNELQTLPGSLGQCQKLELNCSYNQLKALPESLANCQELVLFCNDNYLTDIPNAIKTKLGDNWEITIGRQYTLQNLKNLVPTATKIEADNKPTKDQSNPDSKIDKSIPMPAKKIWPIKVAVILISITLSSFIFAVSGGFALIVALLLKAGTALPTTKVAFAAISIASGLTATTTLWGLYHLGAALKTAIVRYLQSPEQRFKADNNACDEQLAQLAAKFSTNTIQFFVQPLKAIQTQVADPQLIQFKQFEIEACKKVLGLKDTQRSQAKETALVDARNFLKLRD
ncbi:MAG: leucine-rich repeat domain-containing protein [Proteobacteria bacterium]|nr:leucine-rich repeat domain-containing protein [Pseudomonadota bacterium]